MKIRQNGKYYQLGYYYKGKWINVLHLGTPEQLLEKLNFKKPPEDSDVLKRPEQNQDEFN